MKSEKKRIDVLLFEKGYATSREEGKKLVQAGIVKINNRRVLKPSEHYDSAIEIIVTPRHGKYVSRGGEKLEAALDHFALSVQGVFCVDIGISTGGFTDCLLQRGAAYVYGIDVGYGQLAWKLRQDERVTLFERTNIRYFDITRITRSISMAVIDVSFISLSKVMPKVTEMVEENGTVIALVKPQFEVGKGKVGKKGIVRDERLHNEVIIRIKDLIVQQGHQIIGTCTSPLRGAKGNKEFFMVFTKRTPHV